MPKINMSRDPEHFVMPVPTKPSKLVLGLDLGTSTGFTFAFFREGDKPEKVILPIYMGQLDLSAGSYESGAIRFVRLRQFLSVIKPDMVFYEDVKNDPPKIDKFSAAKAIARIATASELIGAYRATVCTWCEEAGVPCSGFKIGTIKKRATGIGNSGKEEVIKACNALFGSDFETEGYESSGADNVADSAFVLLLGLENYALGLVGKEEEDAQD